ncbi:4-hydroxy-tetrahydrodipicolinate synthase [Oceanirhabdus sp. W0125-5]|uniref:4-hydroxy-tetrahydrodipicolinate synthase n=1 Tax=Oceanirhabdus sp. W0125-5 TaxID=2999116 RepID=UPI0022F2C62F|nr:4-hydroxy-tetrahydrodipicolinate synthase [Oceanirhabdus sp. W0125-5]WBW99381.1 4-hydroxy-tetrahydrodipicolinate synthase [Oceanirhabdus sp. W0125-5]
MTLFKGSGVAIVTPFTENGVDFKTLEKLVEWHIEKKTDAIIVCGTTGEASTMSTQEKKETIKFVVDIVNKRIPVIAGTGSNNTAAAINMSTWAEKIGVDGLLIITPYYNKTTQKGLVEHFKAINDSVSIPIIAYNVPSRTGINILPDTLLKISKLSNVNAVKEASGDLSQIIKIRELCGEDFHIYSGNDDQIIPVLSVGGIGVISVLANVIPEETSKMVHLYLEGKTTEALNLQLEYLSLANSLFIETNPIPVKTALNIMGMNAGSLRLPLIDMDQNNKKILESELKKHKLC